MRSLIDEVEGVKWIAMRGKEGEGRKVAVKRQHKRRDNSRIGAEGRDDSRRGDGSRGRDDSRRGEGAERRDGSRRGEGSGEKGLVAEAAGEVVVGIDAAVAEEGPPAADLLGTMEVDVNDEILWLRL